MNPIYHDLNEEYQALDTIVANLDKSEWNTVTPFDNWTIKDEISHIAYYDEAAMLSATDPDAFTKHFENMLEGFTSFDALYEKVNAVGRSMSIDDLLAWWRKSRSELLAAYETLSPKDRLPWYGPTMSPRSSATGRIMEVWAHGQDIVDGLGIQRELTHRLKHIAHIGVTTFKWSFQNRHQDVPEDPVYVELTGPSGDIWTWGPDGAVNKVQGTAHDFCLVVVQRRHMADTHLNASGPVAKKWMSIAQAFAGPPEEPPPAGTFPKA